MASAKDNLTPELIQEIIPSIILPTVAVVLRFWSRWVNRPKGNMPTFWWDDWLCLASLPLALAQGITLAYWTKIGLGKHIFMSSLANIETGLMILYANYFFWNLGVTLTKLSVLCLYARIFKINSRFRIALWIVAALNVAWEVFAIFSAIFQCTPVYKAWRPLDSGHCINYYAWFIAMAVTSLLLDFVVLVLPMPMVFAMSMTLSRKLFVILIFIFGYGIIAFSIGRTVAIVHEGPGFTEDVTYSFIPIGRWLIIENPMCILSVCLPAIFSLFRRGIRHGPASLLRSKDYDSIPSTTGGNSKTSQVRGTESMTNIHKDRQNSLRSNDYESNDNYEMAPRTAV